MTGRAIRAAATQDADGVAAVEAACLGADAWSAALVAEVVAGTVPTVRARVAVEDGEVVGWAAVSAVEDVSELQRLAVLPARRRRGWATGLVREAASIAAAAGAGRLLLEVREDNAAARGLYARLGFAPVGHRPRYYHDGAAAVVLERSLPLGDDPRTPH